MRVAASRSPLTGWPRVLAMVCGALVLPYLVWAGGLPATHDPLNDDPVVLFWRARLDAAPHDAIPALKLAASCLERARLTHDFRFHECAAHAAAEALRRAPGELQAQLLRGATQLALHRFADALKTAEAVIRMHPDAPTGLALRGDARLALGDHLGARADFERLLANDRDLATLVRLSQLQMAEGDAAGARQSLAEAVRAGAERAVAPALLGWALLRLGAAHFRSGDWTAAAKHYAQARELAGDDPEVLDHLAELHAARGDYPGALDLSAQAIAIAPRPEFLQARGDIQAAMDDNDAAMASYRQAEAGYLAASAAGHPLFDHHLASLYSEAPGLKDPAKALHWARRDLKHRRTPASLEALAWAWYQSGAFAKAAQIMDQALEWPVVDAHVLYHASLIYARAGQAERSRELLAAAATANPKFTEFHFHR